MQNWTEMTRSTDLTHKIRLRQLAEHAESVGIEYAGPPPAVMSGDSHDWTRAEAERLLRDADGHQAEIQRQTLAGIE